MLVKVITLEMTSARLLTLLADRWGHFQGYTAHFFHNDVYILLGKFHNQGISYEVKPQVKAKRKN